MKKRQSTVQRFSTLLSFSTASRSLIPTWITEPALERTIEQHVQEYPDKTAEAWALQFLTILQGKSQTESKATEAQNKQSAETVSASHSLAATHQQIIAGKYLSAYLQEACYQAAQKVQKQFQSVQYQYSLVDLFQIGNLLVNQPTKLFRSFNTDYPYSSLESYAKTAIFRFIGNAIYAQDIEAKREKFSDYGLLRDLSHKELKEALASAGINTSQIDAYCLARHCYSTVCQPQARCSSQSLKAPSEEELSQIASCYNQSALSLGRAEAQTIQAMLSVCIQAARRYRTRRVLSLESDDVISDPTATPWDAAIQAEEREQVKALVSQLFASIPETGQTLLKLWLGLDLTQTEIAIVLKHKYPDLQKQYQVARRLGKYSRNFLKDFLQQCQQLNPDLSLQDDKAIELIQASLDECLQLHCKQLLNVHLEHFTQQYDPEGEWLFPDSIAANRLRYQHQSIDIQPGFIQAFETQLEKDLNLSPQSLRAVNQKIAVVVSECLQ